MKNLRKIPNFKTLKILNCGNTNINNLPEGLDFLENLYCVGCHNLTKIPNLKLLKYLNCPFTHN